MPDAGFNNGGLAANHWGVGRADVAGGVIRAVAPHPFDPDPSPLNQNIASSLSGRARVLRPAVRKGWLDNGPGPAEGRRGRDEFVELSWGRALDLLADELKRVKTGHGNQAVFAGSYGWGSAGRFHHPQSQLKRFLNVTGGFTASKGNYSYQAALTLLPHIAGEFRGLLEQTTRFSNIAKHGELMVMFGGFPARNTQVTDGGCGKHEISGALRQCVENGVRFVSISPLRTDAPAYLGAEWLAPRPGTDTAVMMGLAHTLITEDLHDKAFLARYTVGFEKTAAYITGAADGVVKDAAWAAEISGLDAGAVRALARDMAAKRTMVCCAAGLQRADYGEQPLWMTVTLAAMLGQVGLPGAGWTIGYGVNGVVGAAERIIRPGALPLGENPVKDFIPVAMIAEMLLNPGGAYNYNGQSRSFPDIRMVWWAGGNPFHHHQNLNRMREAFQRPDTVVVNEINWTATARHADFVLPAAAPEERRDFVSGKQDNCLVPSPRLVPPPGESRAEYETYAALAERMGVREAFTEGMSEEDWLKRMWDQTRAAAQRSGFGLPDWETFMAGGPVELPDPAPDRVFLSEFRADPGANPLQTPSGRIELASAVIESFGYDDCPGHPVWRAPRDLAAGANAAYPLAMISGQPGTRLHSQLDNGDYSLSQKIKGREPVLIHPGDAAPRGVADGDIVELFNARGRCLAGARVTEDIAKGVVFLWTGAWYDPDFDRADARDRHGNPNVLTHDLRASRLSQGPASHSAYVEVSRLEGPAPDVQAHEPPVFAAQGGGA